MYEMVKYGEKLIHEIHFWTVNVKLLEKEVEKEEKLILDLWNRVIKEIDYRNSNGTESKS